MTNVPNGVRPNPLTINMMGRGAGGEDGQGQGGEEEEGDGEQQWQEEELGGFAQADEDNEDEVADLFGNFSEEEQEGEQQQPRRVRQRRSNPPEANEGAEAQEDHREEVPPPPNVQLPIAPSQEEWDEHFRTHINFRNWCPVCVEARGRENPHYRRKEQVRPGLPTICMDYKEIRKGRPPIIVVKDQATKSTFCHQALRKGATDQWVVNRVLRDIENTGHVAVTLKGDGEPAMRDFLRAIKEQRSQPANIEHSPGNDPQSKRCSRESGTRRHGPNPHPQVEPRVPTWQCDQ